MEDVDWDIKRGGNVEESGPGHLGEAIFSGDIKKYSVHLTLVLRYR